MKGGMRQYWRDVESILKWPRSAPPADVTGGYSFATRTPIRYRRDVNPGVPLELFGSQYPGGKIFNKAAFTAPPSGQEGNFGRNVLRGFGAFQGNFAIQRQCQLTERVGLRFRNESFINIPKACWSGSGRRALRKPKGRPLDARLRSHPALTPTNRPIAASQSSCRARSPGSPSCNMEKIR